MSQGRNGDPRLRFQSGVQIWAETDLALAAYYLMNKVELVKVTPRRGSSSNSQDMVFHFRDDGETIHRLRLLWANSSIRDYDNAMRTLKKEIQAIRKLNRKRPRQQARQAHQGDDRS